MAGTAAGKANASQAGGPDTHSRSVRGGDEGRYPGSRSAKARSRNCSAVAEALAFPRLAGAVAADALGAWREDVQIR